MQTLSPKFRSQKYFSYGRYAEKLFTQIYRDLSGDAILVPIWLGTNMAAGNQQKHLLFDKHCTVILHQRSHLPDARLFTGISVDRFDVNSFCRLLHFITFLLIYIVCGAGFP